MPPVGLPSCARHPWTPMSERGCPQCYATLRSYIDEAHPNGQRRTHTYGGNGPERVRAEPKPRVYQAAPARKCASSACGAVALRWSNTGLCGPHAQERRVHNERMRIKRLVEKRRASRHAAGLMNVLVVELDGVVAHLAEHARRLGVHRATVLRRWRKTG